MRWLALALLTIAAPVGAGEYFTLKGHGGPIMDVTTGPGGRIATASFDNAVGLWTDGVPTWLDGHAAAVNAVLLADDDLAFSAGDDFTVMRWSLTTGTGQPMTGHRGKVVALALSRDAGLLASASWDGSIGLWPLAGGDPVMLAGHDGPVNDVVFSADGGLLYSASADGTIRVWDVADRIERARLVEHGFGINELVLSPAGDWLAYGAVDGVTRIVDPGSGAAIADLSLERRPILAMDASEQGLLAVGDGEGYIMVVATDGWRIVQDFRATTHGPIWALAFSPDGANIHAGGLDDTLHSWPVGQMAAQNRMQTADRSFLADPALMPNGERQFKRKCSICHTLTPGSARRAGPTLHGLFGRRAGTVSDYSYSDALDGSELIWNDATIDALFDIGPEHYVPGTKMPMQRITGAQDRADLIAYLRRETAPNEERP
ncbi:c-type cytochrome [Thalassococcus sp. BH17M4-6]|uniref:c-type cytochrome n=1 Tax=Thalassococcus sp. BH17M4-6 TaxID=3413148 RepID=UPI003BED74BB